MVHVLIMVLKTGATWMFGNTDHLCKLNFEVWSYSNLFLRFPPNFGLLAALFIQNKTGKALMNQVVMPI